MRWPALNPLGLFLGPVFQKEVRSAGRRRGTYLARTFTAIGLLGTVGFAFMIWALDSPSSGLARMQSLQSLAPAMAMVVVWFQFVMLGFLAPQLTAGGICDERRAQTLSALLTTPLRPSSIVFGKLTSRIVQLLILSLLAVPLLLAIRVFGGLSASFVLGGTAIVLSTAILGASLGLMLSLWSRRAVAAAGGGLLLLIVVMVGPMVLELIRSYAIYGVASVVYDELYSTCAPATLFNLSYATAIGIEPREMSIDIGSRSIALGPSWLANSVYNLAVASLAAAFTSMMLRRTMRRMAAEGPPATRESRRARRMRLKSAGALEATQPQGVEAAGLAPEPSPAHRPSREIRGNPVLWRELRQHTFGSRRLLFLFSSLALAGCVLLYWMVPMTEDSLHAGIGILGLLAILGQSVGFTNGAIGSEREANTWEALIATPLTGPQIMWAKYFGVLRGQWFFPTLVFAHFIIAIAVGAFWPPAIMLIVLIMLGPIVFFTATAQLFSLIFPRAITATILNFGLILAMYFGPWVIAGMLQILSRNSIDLFSTNYLTVSFTYNPVAMLASLIESASDRLSRGPRSSFSIANASVSRMQFAGIVASVFVAYVLASLAVLALAARLFTRCSGRTS